MELTLNAEERELLLSILGQLAKSNLAYDTGFSLQPGTYTLKFLARENETGKMGTFERSSALCIGTWS